MPFRHTFVTTLFVVLTSTSLQASAQAVAATSAEPTAEQMRRPLHTWSQAEREWGFRNAEQYAITRVIKRGATVSALDDAPPLAALATGTARGALVDQYVRDYKVGGLLVLHDGRIRLERYALGHSAEQRWTSFSVAKSLTSTLVGAALKDGYIKSLDDPLGKYIKGMNGSAYDGVTVRQLLTMTTGVKWNEDYTDPKADVWQLFATAPDADTDSAVSYLRKLPRAAPAGRKWLYNTGETNLLGALISQATGKSLSVYLSEKIWAPYGMQADATWRLGVTNNEQAGCCIQATLRDYARVGQFILDGAKINGKSIVPDGFMAAATNKQADIGAAGRGYGYQWWTRDDGTYAAVGIHGQLMHIDPARKLVVVINAAWPVAHGQKEVSARNEATNAIAAAIDAEKALLLPPTVR